MRLHAFLFPFLLFLFIFTPSHTYAQVEGPYTALDLVRINSQFRDGGLKLYANQGLDLERKVFAPWRSNPTDSAFYFSTLEEIGYLLSRPLTGKQVRKKLARLPGYTPEVTPLSEEQIQSLRDHKLLLLMINEFLEPRFPYRMRNFEMDNYQLDMLNFVQPQAGEIIADIGAGGGMMTLFMAALVSDSTSFIATELKERDLLLMNFMTQLLLPESPHSFLFLQSSKDNCMLEPASTDRILLINTFHHIKKKEPFLESLREALRPGGTLLLMEPIQELAFQTIDGPICRKAITESEVLTYFRAAGFTEIEEVFDDHQHRHWRMRAE